MFRFLRPISTRCFTTQIHRARVNALLFGADRLLLTPRADTLECYLMTRLSADKLYNTYRSIAFMRLIRFCLERHLFDLALVLHDRMLKEGFIPLHALSLRMSALSIARRATHPSEITPPLKEIFEQNAYDVPAFLDLVRYLAGDRRALGALVDDLANTFVSIRRITLSEHPDLVGELASINMRADRLDAAQKWLRVFEDACGTQGVSPAVTPYSEIINTLNDIDPKNGEAVQDVLVRMKSAGVSPNASIFNALIRANFIQQRYQEAFALYHVLMEKRSDTLMPNDVTYKMLFRATNLLSLPRISRRHRRPENAIPPRRLFREMLSCHLEQTNGRTSSPSTVVSVSALHLALRIFMAREDYAAAFVVISALDVFGFKPNLQTYLIVIVSLLHRMKREAALPCPQDSVRLVDFLTHLRPGDDPNITTLLHRIRERYLEGPSTLRADIIAHLLALGEQTRCTADDLPCIPTLPPTSSPEDVTPLRQRRRPPRIPSVAMLTGAEEDPPLASEGRTFFSPIPLARIVHKALLGELFRKAMRRGTDWDWKGAVGPIIEETGRELVPEGISEGLEAEELGTGRDVLPFAAARMRRRRRSARGGREIAFGFES